MEVQVNKVERLDKYLAENTDMSRSTIEKMIKEDYIYVNNKVVKASYKLKLTDIITIKEGYVEVPDILPTKMPLDIVYEDKDLMIINKPSGLVVHPGSGNFNNTLVNGLMAYTKDLSDGEAEFRPGIVHRIDKDTSGLIIIAKNNIMHEELSKMFKAHTIKREYIALLVGELPHNTMTIDAPIGRDPKYRQKMAVTSINSKNAITHVTVLKRYQGYTLVKCLLETGRTHQIRVHMKYIGYPVFNDPLYSNKTIDDFGQFLHSYSVDFIKPITGEHIHFECPLPKQFEDFINTLN
jgi:23S rRNA pseudouridine1911/1915/1917 synthase